MAPARGAGLSDAAAELGVTGGRASRLLQLATDASPGDWLVRAVGPFGSGVGALVPPVFEAYARIRHSAHARPGADTLPQAPRFDAPPPSGNLPPLLLAALLDRLRAHTTTPDRCWFGLWDGYGWVNGSPAVASLTTAGARLPRHQWLRRRRPGPPEPGLIPPAFGPESRTAERLRLPERNYLLFSGPLEAALEMGWRPTEGAFDPQSPNLTWPDDRAWFVSTEIDLDSTYVGGTRELVDQLLADHRLECLLARATDDVTAASDDIDP